KSVGKAAPVAAKLGKKPECQIGRRNCWEKGALTEKEFVADFAKSTGMPTMIITTPTIGTLNHTLLTVMACKEFGINVRRIIVNKMPKKPTIEEQKTPDMIESLKGIKVGILPLPID